MLVNNIATDTLKLYMKKIQPILDAYKQIKNADTAVNLTDHINIMWKPIKEIGEQHERKN